MKSVFRLFRPVQYIKSNYLSTVTSQNVESESKETHFGFQKVKDNEKTRKGKRIEYSSRIEYLHIEDLFKDLTNFTSYLHGVSKT